MFCVKNSIIFEKIAKLYISLMIWKKWCIYIYTVSKYNQEKIF